MTKLVVKEAEAVSLSLRGAIFECYRNYGLLHLPLIRFGIVGGFATLVHMLAAWILLTLFPWSSLFLVNLIAFSAALLVSFFGHRHFTFRTAGSLPRFLLAASIGLAVNNCCLLAMAALGFEGLEVIILAAAISPLAVFLLSKYWVFG